MVGVAVVGVGGFAFSEYWEDRPRPLTEMGGLQLGMDSDEVTFLWGKPIKVDGNTAYYQELFDGYDYIVEYEAGMDENGVMVSRVGAIYTRAASRYSLPFGLSKSSASREDIIEQLGDPDVILKNLDGLGRRLEYHRYNVEFQLEKNRITGWGIKAW